MSWFDFRIKLCYTASNAQNGGFIMNVNYIRKAEEKLTEEGQLQLLRFMDEISETEKKSLLKEISQVDYEMIRAAMASGQAVKKNDRIDPIHTVTVSETVPNREHWEKIGREALGKEKVAAVILAGGQGTRLGFDGPKGTLNVGESKEKYLFEILFENIVRNTGRDAVMPVYIMTSVINHEATDAFLKEHQYFGYPEEKVHLFKQDMAPALDLVLCRFIAHKE